MENKKNISLEGIPKSLDGLTPEEIQMWKDRVMEAIKTNVYPDGCYVDFQRAKDNRAFGYYVEESTGPSRRSTRQHPIQSPPFFSKTSDVSPSDQE